MFSKETDISAFFNLKVCLEPGGLVGFIEGTFGTSGQSAVSRGPALVHRSTLERPAVPRSTLSWGCPDLSRTPEGAQRCVSCAALTSGGGTLRLSFLSAPLGVRGIVCARGTIQSAIGCGHARHI